jgi:hypothetical protein
MNGYTTGEAQAEISYRQAKIRDDFRRAGSRLAESDESPENENKARGRWHLHRHPAALSTRVSAHG